MSARRRRGLVDPNQIELGILWRSLNRPFRLQAGDVIPFNGKLCRVIHVNDSAATVMMNRPVRDFKTRFDKPVRFHPSPVVFRISPNSETPVLNRRV